ncbi:hypothetical protein [Micromonospora sp. NBRC 101691]|uniref:hypothetical protein n=1 Tax=Micromonospora sp. NBRC 101691 TaxID=3032198 RepID=UPI0024A58234|nr:hypothetical protein [Micromonospora sp. NBRC 101691]GLY23456.1 hypothetical protein Misp04_31880 [Micromonospora sp. NBRC 101691]
MKSGTRIGLAVGLGYVLGRRRRLRTALTLAAAVAAGRMSRDPAGLRKLGDLVQASPQLSNLSRLGGPLVGAGRAAATAAVGSGIDAVSGKLRGRADALRGKATGGGDGDGEDRGDGGDRSDRGDGGDGGGQRDRRGRRDSGDSAGQRGW